MLNEEVRFGTKFNEIILSLKDKDPVANMIYSISVGQDKSRYDLVEAPVGSMIGIVNFTLNGSSDRISQIRLGRLVRGLISDNGLSASDSDIESFVNKYRHAYEEMSVKFEVWTGERIHEAYQKKNYSGGDSPIGSLGCSCMNNASEEDLQFYIKNDDKISILVLLKDGKIIGRALLWKINGFGGSKQYLDRVYVTHDHYYLNFRKWAAENSCLSFENLPNINRDLSVTIKHYKMAAYPYLDTFHLMNEEGVFRNWFKSGWGNIYVVNRDGYHITGHEITRDPISGVVDRYHSNNDYYDKVFSDAVTGMDYLLEDCEERDHEMYGVNVRIKTHKKIHDVLEDHIKEFKYQKNSRLFPNIGSRFIPVFIAAKFSRFGGKFKEVAIDSLHDYGSYSMFYLYGKDKNRFSRFATITMGFEDNGKFYVAFDERTSGSRIKVESENLEDFMLRGCLKFKPLSGSISSKIMRYGNFLKKVAGLDN